MKILTREELGEVLRQTDIPIAFARYSPCIIVGDILIADGLFGATPLLPDKNNPEASFNHDNSYDWDFYLDEDYPKYVIFEKEDVRALINKLRNALEAD